MTKLYLGPGFLIGIFLSLIYAPFALFMLWYAVSEQLWAAGILGLLAAWMSYSAVTELLKWFSIPPQNMLGVNEKIISLNGDIKQIDLVIDVALHIKILSKKLNFISSGNDFSGLAKITFNDGTSFRIRSGQGPFTVFSSLGPDLGRSDVNDFLLKLTHISHVAGIEPRKVGPEDIVR